MHKNKEIKLGTYPYVSTRVKVMKSSLIDRQNYRKLMKMSLNEILQFLQQEAYKNEINGLGVKYGGIELIEMALNLNSANTYKKVLSMSKGGLKEIVRVLLKRFDVSNVKNILRGKFAGATYDEIISMLVPAGDFDLEFLSNLAKKETIGEVVSALKPSLEMQKALSESDAKKTLAPIENALDKEYYAELRATAERLPKKGLFLTQFIRTEIESNNIRLLLRLKSAGADPKEIVAALNPQSHKLSRKAFEDLAYSADINALAANLEKTYYGPLIFHGIKKFREDGTLSVIETDLSKHLLRQATLFLHQHPLSIGPIIGFSAAKESEVRNLRMIAHARYRGLPESFMEEMLVV